MANEINRKASETLIAIGAAAIVLALILILFSL